MFVSRREKNYEQTIIQTFIVGSFRVSDGFLKIVSVPVEI